MDVHPTSLEWKTELTGVQFGSDPEAQWGYKETYAVYDSSVQCVYYPEEAWNWFSDEILDYTTGWYNDAMYGPVTSCDNVNLLPTIWFMLKGKDGSNYWV